MSGGRNQFGDGYRPFNPAPVKARPRHRAAEDHSYHLMMLQERNRLLKKMGQRGQKDVELERKEKGFSLYLNGANLAPPPRHGPKQPQSQTRPSKTACSGDEQSPDQEGRSKTAPSSKRKSWSHETITVRTQDGESLPITAPSIISGCYDDDFESSAAEMTDEESAVESGSEGGEGGEGGEGEEGDSEELTESVQELSQQCSSLEATLTSGCQDSLVQSGQSSEAEREDTQEEKEREAEREGEVFQEVPTPSPGPATSSLAAISDRVKQLEPREQRRLLEILNNTLSSASFSETTPTPEWPRSRPTESPLTGVARPVSTRSTGLRGEMARRTNDPELCDVGMVDCGSHGRPFRSASARTSGIRGQLLSRAQSDHTIDDPREGGRERLTGGWGASERELHCSCPRPETAVLAPGHRPLRVGPQLLLLPAVTSQPLPLLTDEPCDPTHWPHPSPDLNESLASISYFDHTHQGQLGLTSADEDLLHNFLTDYQQMKTEHSDSSQTEVAPSTLPLSPSPPEEDPEVVWEEGEGGKEGEGRGYSTPELPTGQQLVLNLLTTWGDQFYIGLTGLEIFTISGERASIAEISADPADINVLPEYSGDPRVVANLLDGVNHTKDDLHMWLAPFTPSHPHTITVAFSSTTSLAVVRIWNYNKSRIHSYRGVRDMEMWLDQQLVFRGEIKRASGGILSRTGDSGETILFTTDEDILFRVGLHDDCFLKAISCCHGETVHCCQNQESGGVEEGTSGEYVISHS